MSLKNNNTISDERFVGGETKMLKFYIRDEHKIPVDLNGYTATLKVCKWGDYNNVILERECEIDADTTLGLIRYNLVSGDTNTWSDGIYSFQLTLLYSDQIAYKKQGVWYVKGVIGWWKKVHLYITL